MMDGQAEVVSFKFISGPREGTSQFKITAWPPPEELFPREEGVYVREAYSHLPDEVAAAEMVMRGAVYRWEKHADVLPMVEKQEASDE